MNMNEFLDKVLAAARAAGIEPAEVYYNGNESFRVGALDGEISDYSVSTKRSVSLRGMVNGRMGEASTEAFDDEAVGQMIDGVKEAAALLENDELDEIFAGEKTYPTVEKVENDVATTTPEEKIARCLKMEELAKKADSRVVKVPGTMLISGCEEETLRNSYGLNLHNDGSYFAAHLSVLARDGDSVASNGKGTMAYRFEELSAEKLAKEAVENTVSQLHAAPVPTGEYRVILDREAMQSLLQTFWGVFSAQKAQQNLSLMAGREGEMVASEVVTLIDDPLMKGGVVTSAFDGEGSASRTKKVVDAGQLVTLLHNRRTARKQGVETTGNAGRSGGTIFVRPTNFYLQAGEKTLAELMADLGDGLVITELSGLHAGANPNSGDFSLLSKGYTVENGQRGRAVEQITVAGNFYDLLKNIRAVGNDLMFEGSNIGTPSVDVGTLKISG